MQKVRRVRAKGRKIEASHRGGVLCRPFDDNSRQLSCAPQERRKNAPRPPSDTPAFAIQMRANPNMLRTSRWWVRVYHDGNYR